MSNKGGRVSPDYLADIAPEYAITPKRIKRSNGTVLTPDMEITVTVNNFSDPFYNGAKEIQQMYMRIYGFDYKKANCHKSDFDFVKLG